MPQNYLDFSELACLDLEELIAETHSKYAQSLFLEQLMDPMFLLGAHYKFL
jgi:hypothetical protein